MDRRVLTLALLTLPLACGARSPAPSVAAAPAWSPRDAGLTDWLANFRAKAVAAGVSGDLYDRATASVGLNTTAIDKDRNQAEFTLTLRDYIGRVASDERLALGATAFRAQSDTLARIANSYGVAPAVVAAVWGIESAFGTRRGTYLVIEALATLAYDGRRAAFYESQLIAALQIIQAGNVDADHMTGSWAGAMGHTQFIPTSYLAYAVDFTGDGKRDIWSDDPTDALASTAAYLARSGWTPGQPILTEVILPDGFDRGLIGKGTKKTSADWTTQGVRAARGTLSEHGASSVLQPDGPGTTAVLAHGNFRAVLRYNNADVYAIAVGYLAQRLGGGPGFVA